MHVDHVWPLMIHVQGSYLLRLGGKKLARSVEMVAAAAVHVKATAARPSLLLSCLYSRKI